MIKGNNVSLIYENGTKALEDINIDIKRGELVYITGSSGSGKTSLLKLFMGIEYPSTGTLMVKEQLINKQSVHKIRELRRDIGPIFQEFKLIKGRTALENVTMGLGFLDFSIKKRKELAIESLTKVGLLEKANKLVDHLSFGETQRVAIARAVARKPSIILADEPTGNLDQDNAIHIIELLTSLKDINTTVIITTHATHLIKGQDARYLEINGGRLIIK